MLKRLHLILLVVQLFAFLTAKAYYDPSTRSFLSRDPYREGGGTNHYAYCFNRPFQYVDPTGAAPVELGAQVDNGKAKVLMEDWSNPLGFIFGGTKTWWQDPTASQLARLFHSENGELRVADYSERHDVFWQQYDPASKIAAAQAAATSSAVAKMTYGPLALVSGWGALAEGGVTVGTVLFAGHEGYAGGAMLLGAFTGKDYAVSPEGLLASNFGASPNTVGMIDATVGLGVPFLLLRGDRARQTTPIYAPEIFNFSDVDNAIMRLKMRGISPFLGNKDLVYNQIIRLATAMRKGTFDPNVGILAGDIPIFDDFSSVIISGHQRIIAAEMTGFPLPIERISAKNPVIQAGKWEDIISAQRLNRN